MEKKQQQDFKAQQAKTLLKEQEWYAAQPKLVNPVVKSSMFVGDCMGQMFYGGSGSSSSSGRTS